MAKKTENRRAYLSAYLPEEIKKYKSTRINWGGLNLKNSYNSGELSYANGISVSDLPYIEPEKNFEEFTLPDESLKEKYSADGCTVLGFYVYEINGNNNYAVVYALEENGNISIYLDVVLAELEYYYASSSGGKGNPVNVFSGTNKVTNYVCTSVIKSNATDKDITTPRTILEFNAYDSTVDPVGTETTKKILIFPDKISFFADFEAAVWKSVADADSYKKHDTKKCYLSCYQSSTDDDIDFHSYVLYDGEKWIRKGYFYYSLGETFPNLKYACVNNQRLYGVDDVRIYVSGYNNYADFELDNVLYSTEAGAWAVTTQASASDGGEFTAIAGFGEEVVAFKNNYMYRITGSVNPFRLREVCEVGCVDARSVCVLDGRMYFASQNSVYVYRDGYLPSVISTAIENEITNISSAVGYIENNRYHLSIGKTEYIYDILNGKWTKNITDINLISYSVNRIVNSEESNEKLIFAGKNGFFKIGSSFKKNWELKTDFTNNYTSDPKKIHKLQLMYEIEPDAKISIYMSDKDEELQIYSYIHDAPTNDIRSAVVLLRYRDIINYSIVVKGSGYVKLHAMELIYEKGGELFE